MYCIKKETLLQNSDSQVSFFYYFLCLQRNCHYSSWEIFMSWVWSINGNQCVWGTCFDILISRDKGSYPAYGDYCRAQSSEKGRAWFSYSHNLIRLQYSRCTNIIYNWRIDVNHPKHSPQTNFEFPSFYNTNKNKLFKILPIKFF